MGHSLLTLITTNQSGDGTFPWGKKGNLGGRSPPFIEKCEAFLLHFCCRAGAYEAFLLQGTPNLHSIMPLKLAWAQPPPSCYMFQCRILLLSHVSTQPPVLVTCFNTALDLPRSFHHPETCCICETSPWNSYVIFPSSMCWNTGGLVLVSAFVTCFTSCFMFHPFKVLPSSRSQFLRV